MSWPFRIDFPSITLSVNQIWPDGDGPANPTPEDVIETMRKCSGSPVWVALDWDLITGLEVDGVEWHG